MQDCESARQKCKRRHGGANQENAAEQYRECPDYMFTQCNRTSIDVAAAPTRMLSWTADRMLSATAATAAAAIPQSTANSNDTRGLEIPQQTQVAQGTAQTTNESVPQIVFFSFHGSTGPCRAMPPSDAAPSPNARITRAVSANSTWPGNASKGNRAVAA